MEWVSLVLALIKAVGAVTTLLNNRNLIDSGGAAKIAEALQGQADDLKKKRAEIAAADADFDAGRGVPEYRPDDTGTGGGKSS